jgi:hypothetical protein
MRILISENIAKSISSKEMYEILATEHKNLFSFIDRPSGRYLHSIDLTLKEGVFLEKVEDIVAKHGWYISRRNNHNNAIAITQKHIDAALLREVPPTLYHVAPISRVGDIFKHGITPRSEDIRHKYPPRIYAMKTLNGAKAIGKELKSWKNGEEMAILKIDLRGLAGLNIYNDDTSAYIGAVYISGINNIPTNNISMVDSF